jgi:hypothetical protein
MVNNMNQQQYRWQMYTRPLLVLLGILALPTAFFAYGLIMGSLGTFAYIPALMFYVPALWFYLEEIHPYKNSQWTEPLNWDQVTAVESSIIQNQKS